MGGKKYNKKKISYNYSVSKDDYGIIEDYRCKTFEEVAKKK